MRLTANRGEEIRKEYSTNKEQEICNQYGLTQLGGSRTKIDGTNGEINASIKNFSGSSTQVHLTTQNKFNQIFKLNENSKKFIEMFCGNENMDNNGKDRFFTPEIDTISVNSFMEFLESNKIQIIDLIISNGFNINSLIYKNLKTNKIFEISYNQIIDKVKDSVWVLKKGGIHLKNSQGKTYFHLQREGKKNKNNRYNILFHVHSNLFN